MSFWRAYSLTEPAKGLVMILLAHLCYSYLMTMLKTLSLILIHRYSHCDVFIRYNNYAECSHVLTWSILRLCRILSIIVKVVKSIWWYFVFHVNLQFICNRIESKFGNSDSCCAMCSDESICSVGLLSPYLTFAPPCLTHNFLLLRNVNGIMPTYINTCSVGTYILSVAYVQL